EDDATDLNDVEKALHLVNIELRDSETSFRPLGDVIDDVAARWNSLNDIEQSAVANAIAGVRQRENFLVLMSNYSEVLKAQTIASQSAGLSAQRYGIYLDGVEASANKAKAAWEGVWQETINSNAIKFFYDLSAAMGVATKGIGGLIPLLTTVTGLLVALNSVKVMSIGKQIAGLFTGAMTGNPVAIVGLIVAAIGALVSLVNSFPTAEEKIRSINDEIQSSVDKLAAFGDQKTYLANLIKEFENLRDKTALTAEETDRYYELQKLIYDILPETNISYDEQGRLILTNKNNLSLLNVEMEKQIANQKAINLELYTTQALELASAARALFNPLPSSARGFTAGKEFGAGENLLPPVVNMEGITDDNREILEGIADELVRLHSLTDGQIDLSFLKDMPELAEMVWSKVMELNSGLAEFPKAIAEGNESAAQLLPTLDQIVAGMNAVTAAQKEWETTGNLSAETVIKLIGANASLAPYLHQTANGFYLDAAGAKAALYAEMLLYFQTIDLKNGNTVLADAAVAAASGNYILAASAIAASGALAEEKLRMLELLSAFANMSFTIPTYGGGGSSGNPNQKEIDELNAKKKALQKILDEFRKYIKLQKESLRLQKEEKDFTEDLAKKHKSLAELKKELAIISMDTSEEGMARRLELEEEIAELEYEIASDLEDRKYELMQQALDKMLELFENSINEQIEAIDELIDALTKVGTTVGGVGGKFEKMFESEVPLTMLQNIRKYLLEEFGPAIDDVAQDEMETLINAFIAAGGKVGDMTGAWVTLIAKIREAIEEAKKFATYGYGGGGGEGCFIAGTMVSMANGIDIPIEKVKVGDLVLSHDIVTNKMIPAEVSQTLVHPKETVVGYLVINDNLCVTPEHTVCVNESWKFAGDLKLGELFTTLNNQREIITSIEWVSESVPVYNLGTNNEYHNFFANGYLVHNEEKKYHTGGMVEEHHTGGDFAGGLKSNEVFAKLLKGEFVATQGQMDRFMNRILPSMMGDATQKGVSIREKGGGDINIKMPIQVLGNLDKDSLPAFEKLMEKSFKKMTQAMTAQGYKRTTNNYGS
ncbi:polymorphic toxin-type HINT domain-containing protein, partial [Candidatus Dojkabacteria bacterium]|nr:polymorphic toxin-type HINT domain-containing protein [Candidatus Dojkabacteria bacterium]